MQETSHERKETSNRDTKDLKLRTVNMVNRWSRAFVIEINART